METDTQANPTAPDATPPQPVTATASGVFLVDDQQIEGNGQSAPVALGPLAGKTLSVVLGIQESVEQQSLEVMVLGSNDGETWLEKPLLHFPQKFYAGVSELLLDLSSQPEIRFLKASWAANRWGRGPTTPSFRAYIFLRLA